VKPQENGGRARAASEFQFALQNKTPRRVVLSIFRKREHLLDKKSLKKFDCEAPEAQLF